MRILLVKLSSLGDVIHNLPVVTDLRTRYPEARIDWVVEAPYAELVKLHPGVNETVPVSLRQLKRAWWRAAAWRKMSECKARLAAGHYDTIVDTQGLLKSAWVAHWANGPVSGFSAQSAREPLAARFYGHRFDIEKGQHAAVRNRQLAAAALGYQLPDVLDYGLKEAFARNEVNKSAPYVVLLHATSRANKQWPVSHWVALARALAKQRLLVVLPWGSAAERATSNEIARQIDNAMVPNALSLVNMAQCLARARAVVGVDTGLAHLAVALHRPVVGLYVSTQPALTGLLGGEKVINLGGGSESSPLTPGVDEVLATLSPWLNEADS